MDHSWLLAWYSVYNYINADVICVIVFALLEIIGAPLIIILFAKSVSDLPGYFR